MSRCLGIAVTQPERALLVRALRELVGREPRVSEQAGPLLEVLANAVDAGAVAALDPNRTDDPVQMELDYYRAKLGEHDAA